RTVRRFSSAPVVARVRLALLRMCNRAWRADKQVLRVDVLLSTFPSGVFHLPGACPDLRSQADTNED
ncbi:hypothetical protein IscW_ISCW003479, partial [Ixodes scapularis]